MALQNTADDLLLLRPQALDAKSVMQGFLQCLVVCDRGGRRNPTASRRKILFAGLCAYCGKGRLHGDGKVPLLFN